MNIQGHRIYRNLIDEKFRNNIKLNQEEQDCFCEETIYQYKRNFPICDDRRFYELYLLFYDNGQDYNKFNDLMRNDFLAFVDDWGKLIQTNRHREYLMQIISKETRDTIKLLEQFDPKKELIIKSINRKRKIYAFSKNVYIKVKSFSLAENAISVKLGKQEIDIDEYSLVHIYFRHFAKLVKPYNVNDKSFFSDKIHYNDLPYFLERTFIKINDSGLLDSVQLRDLNFRFQGDDYKVYFKKVTKQVAGIGNIQRFRVNTFYPIESDKDKSKLKDLYLVRIDSDLSVYVK